MSPLTVIKKKKCSSYFTSFVFMYKMLYNPFNTYKTVAGFKIEVASNL